MRYFKYSQKLPLSISDALLNFLNLALNNRPVSYCGKFPRVQYNNFTILVGYEYRDPGEASDWVIIIAVLGAFVGCGFLACTIYCLWDKIHTSYNVLQV